jgi:hypothetical protein
MKTTVELPEELMRAVKTCSINEDRDLSDMIAVLLRRTSSSRPIGRSASSTTSISCSSADSTVISAGRATRSRG